MKIVSTHAPARGATVSCCNVQRLTVAFQPTRPRGARRSGPGRTGPTPAFQPTRPRGARRPKTSSPPTAKGFQPTRPRGARPCRSPISASTTWSFNPRAREGRDAEPRPSISTTSAFQPTRPRGARRLTGSSTGLPDAVSTHAPARGATRSSMLTPARISRFNPRAREGRDAVEYRSPLSRTKFQPTRPRGARPRDARRHQVPHRVSTHAPARGATFASFDREMHFWSFNPRAREGRRPVILVWAQADRTVSTHAPARGATARHDHP